MCGFWDVTKDTSKLLQKIDSSWSRWCHVPEDWNWHQGYISGEPNVCRAAATVYAYCLLSGHNWKWNQVEGSFGQKWMKDTNTMETALSGEGRRSR